MKTAENRLTSEPKHAANYAQLLHLRCSRKSTLNCHANHQETDNMKLLDVAPLNPFRIIKVDARFGAIFTPFGMRESCKFPELASQRAEGGGGTVNAWQRWPPTARRGDASATATRRTHKNNDR
ncbi:hypothetical protein L596_022378 [Steinernema carpocapsae]|uniref:Uncharacterized protein n=1 Tax=Steinernema carpocapsae TaxID=34508 RepID=A0A4U5MLH7_STECR|nr:hypothetical protein L596_022378 [Steinernema carpocapsae]